MVIWIIGLSGSGKSTLASKVLQDVEEISNEKSKKTIGSLPKNRKSVPQKTNASLLSGFLKIRESMKNYETSMKKYAKV